MRGGVTRDALHIEIILKNIKRGVKITFQFFKIYLQMGLGLRGPGLREIFGLRIVNNRDARGHYERFFGTGLRTFR